MDNDFFCPVCSDIYEDPKLLPCAHRLCAGCLNKYVESRRPEFLPTCPCPLCKQPFKVQQTYPTDTILHAACRKRKNLPTSKCIHHQEMTQNRYCKKCNQLVCPECVISTHAHCKWIVSVTQATSEMANLLQKENNFFGNAKKELATTKERVTLKLANAADKNRQLKSQLTTSKSRWIGHIEKLHDDVERSLTEWYKIDSDELSTSLQQIQDAQLVVDEARNAIMEGLETMSGDSIIGACSTIKRKRSSLEKIQGRLTKVIHLRVPQITVEAKPPVFIFNTSHASESFEVLNRSAFKRICDKVTICVTTFGKRVNDQANNLLWAIGIIIIALCFCILLAVYQKKDFSWVIGIIILVLCYFILLAV